MRRPLYGLILAMAVLASSLVGGPGPLPGADTVRAAEIAQEPTTDASYITDEAVASITEQLNCPTCQGYNLRDCPLTVCAQMREQIRLRVAAGADEQTIIDEFVDYYGPQVLNAPPREGFFLLAWWMPPFVLAAGAIGLVTWFVRQRRRRPGGDEVEGSRLESGPTGAHEASESGATGTAADKYAAAFERMAGEDEASE